MHLSLTQGEDPQANGLAEQAVGRLCRMARSATAHLSCPEAKASLWPSAMVWAAQRLEDPKMPPFGAQAIARHPPKAVLGKTQGRAVSCILLHKSNKVSGAFRIGLLADGGRLRAAADRRTIRAALTEHGAWKFPDVKWVDSTRRRGGGDDSRHGAAQSNRAEKAHEEQEAGHLPEDDVPFGDMMAGGGGGDYLSEDDIPFGQLMDRRGGAGVREDRRPSEGPLAGDHTPTRPRSGAESDEEDSVTGQRQDPGHAPRPAEEREGDDEPDAKRVRRGAEEAHMELDYACGLVTRVIPMGSTEARSAGATEAIKKELTNVIAKGVFDPNDIHDWGSVRRADSEAMVGSARMILARKHDELSENEWVYKGRLVFLGSNIRDASGAAVFGAPDDLYGKPTELATVRVVLAIAMLRGWSVDTGDVHGAYLNAELRGPATYVRLPSMLWAAAGVSEQARPHYKDPCIRLRRALYGLPRSGFDWLAKIDDLLTTKLGWRRMPGADSVCAKPKDFLALYVDDILLAGTQKGNGAGGRCYWLR